MKCIALSFPNHSDRACSEAVKNIAMSSSNNRLLISISRYHWDLIDPQKQNRQNLTTDNCFLDDSN